MSGDCDNDAIQLRQEKRLNLQHREHELMQKQKELQLQLQRLYLEQHQLESESNDEPEAEVQYEIPSYCVNCLGDVLEPKSKSSLSSEFSRKSNDGSSASSQQGETQMPPLSDHSRLEAIKFQILLKLGLKNKPNVTSSLPKQFIFDTLRRSGDPSINPNDYTMLFQSSDDLETRDLVLDQLQQLKMSNESNIDDLMSEDLKEAPPEDDQEFDDFYGRTREIITFAERGELRHSKLYYYASTLCKLWTN